MLNQETAQFIANNLRARKTVLGDSGKPEVLAQLDRAIQLMDALAIGDAIASLWWIDDVYSLTEDDDGDHHPEITKAEARAVLKAADDNHNAEIGINWDVLRENLDIVLEARKDDPNGGDSDDA